MKIIGRKREWPALLGKTHATISPILVLFVFFLIWPWAVDSRSIRLVLLFGLGVCLLDMILISLCSSSHWLTEGSDDSNFIKESLSFSDHAYCS